MINWSRPLSCGILRPKDRYRCTSKVARAKDTYLTCSTWAYLRNRRDAILVRMLRPEEDFEQALAQQLFSNLAAMCWAGVLRRSQIAVRYTVTLVETNLS